MGNNNSISILFLGDIIGKPGREFVVKYVTDRIASAHPPDLVIANVENSAHGFGVTEKVLREFVAAGIKVFSGGNHTFDKKEIFEFIDRYPTLLRPANYPPDTPGRGFCVVEISGVRVGVVNIMGRIFMEPLQSPFLVADQIVAELQSQCDAILVDIHAEATAEKVAMGLYLDGRVSAVVGTHTHVQTADQRVLPGGTAYITDVGCCGPANGVIGMDKDAVFRRMVKQLPTRLDIAKGTAQLNGVQIEVDRSTGRATGIERVYLLEESLVAQHEV
ncbi:MAG: TIGR00282 family metallophosphoesterase [Candidatus Obscuribacterales bacterium]|nr:TIGR00282 family metallophosphoesterase [Candidatus Obscuribacterales bacterium]